MTEILNPPPWKRWLVLTLLTLLVVPPLIWAGWSWITLKYVYARGERAGYVQKFSQKGWLCKTWEGELAMVNLPGAMPEIFRFTVRDPSVAKSIQEHVGQRVNLSYEQHKGVPTACFGDTEYFIVKIATISEASPLSPSNNTTPHSDKPFVL